MESITNFIGGGYNKMLGREFRFKTVEEAENFFGANLARHNEDEEGRDYWLENIKDEIEEVYNENHNAPTTK
jgi:hypothetical protein